jgi:hypothetical protein
MMARPFLWIAALALSASLSACSSRPANWTKEGVNQEVTAADYAECRRAAQHDIQRDVNIDTDIAASREHDWDHSQSGQTYLAEDASNNRKLSGDIVKGCMESKGYAPSGPAATEGPDWRSFFNLSFLNQ